MAKSTENGEGPREVGDLKDEYVICRDLRHAWEEVGYFRERGGGRYGAVYRSLRCARCEMRRNDVLSENYSQKQSSYDAPKGYRIHGQGRTSSWEVREEAVKRHNVIMLSHDELMAALKEE